MKLWFTADSHYGQARTLELSKRPFDSVDQMDKQIIDNWNSVVSKDDIVYHLGDIGDFDKVSKLNAMSIRLVLGNYETDHLVGLSERLGSRIVIINNPSNLVKIDNVKFTLIHKPEEANDLAGDFYLFGHIHKLQMVKRNGLNVGTDCHNFYPIDSETIMFYYNAIMNHYDENVFMNVLG